MAILSGDNEQVLLWGDRVDLAALSQGFRALGREPGTDCHPFLPAAVRLVIAEPATGMQRDGASLMWRIASKDALHFADLIDVLASAPCAWHQYLDVDVNSGFGIEVKVSTGEYPEDFRP
ncbi:MAG: hypothetical protein P4M09_10865 [Devosia sp.]|nr:hypothetical protein [Devosia sp.]